MAQAISKSDLFARLAEGHAARITVVTPNRRLSHSLMADFDDHQVGARPPAWEAPDILPFGAFVERLWEDALYSERELPLLLTPAQEQHLWEQILAGSASLSCRRPPRSAATRGGCAHHWRIPAGPGGDDAQAFREWARNTRRARAATSMPHACPI